MTKSMAFMMTALLGLVACGAEGEAGDACTTDADCAEGLECHVHDHEEEEEGEEHAEEDAGGVCESHDDEE